MTYISFASYLTISLLVGDMNARALFDSREVVGARANRRRKQLANKNKRALAESSSIRSGQSRPPVGVTPLAPVATASVVTMIRSSSPILPSRVQMVVPRFQEVIQSDQIRTKCSFFEVCIPNEIVLHSISNTIHTMITLTNLSESIEQLKKDTEDTCRAFMSEINIVHGERNSCKTELEQLKSSSGTEINQLKAEIDRLQKSHVVEVEQLKVDAEADPLQALEEEGEILNNMFFRSRNTTTVLI
ncbi:uncharacterized protein LOC133789553 [Humulus lupulus]|uniref:uncharacterized protein LOC133789553 n=1 Tax=Humulus lupulus TaxID=3486 RepID=UPI002B405358|nr:uncharacterized protein LOC133789553 [Humulus lupulus]